MEGGSAGRETGWQGGQQGEEKEVGRRMQTGGGDQAFPDSQNRTKEYRKREEQNKMDKQEKNRKPVNQGKLYL